MEKDLSTRNSESNSNTSTFQLKNEIEVVLVTSLPDEYIIPNNRLSIPANFDTEKLRKLVKKLLNIRDEESDLGSKSKNFIFFIDDILLDQNLNSFLTNYNFDLKKISETGLTITYSFEISQPNLINTIKEDEWIRKISLRKNQKYQSSSAEFYCVGLFNSEVSFYNPKFEKVLKIVDTNKDDNYCELLHDLLFFSTNDSLQENTLIKASRNEDYLFHIFNVNLSNMSYNLNFVGEKKDYEYVNTLGLNPVDFSYFVAGDTNGNIKIYKLSENAQSEEPAKETKKKRRKIEANYLRPEAEIENCHNNSEVKILKWINNQQILSSGDDFIIKLWNVHTKTNYSVFNTNYKLTTALCEVLPGNDKFLSGHEDGSIRLWDIRANNSNQATKIVYQNAHQNYVADIVTNPDTEIYSNNFASVGYDGYLRVWDFRSTKKALYEIKTDSEKNYSAVYNSKSYLMTGGDNSTVNVYQC
jgi:WD40 repeat protein